MPACAAIVGIGAGDVDAYAAAQGSPRRAPALPTARGAVALLSGGHGTRNAARPAGAAGGARLSGKEYAVGPAATAGRARARAACALAARDIAALSCEARCARGTPRAARDVVCGMALLRSVAAARTRGCVAYARRTVAALARRTLQANGALATACGGGLVGHASFARAATGRARCCIAPESALRAARLAGGACRAGDAAQSTGLVR